jgi:dihydrofolate synthase/folylpolyglutamate synthase
MITRQALGRGLKTNYWPGRFMPIRKNPTVIIDVAHNREGFWAVLNTLKNRYPGRKFDFLIGMVEKKHGDKCVRSLGSLANSISLAPLENERSDDPYFLASRLNFKKLSVRLYPTASIAIKDLLENSHPSDILILMGSHFLMGELAPFIKRDGF